MRGRMHRANRAGFTVMEMLSVVFIIGLIALVAVPSFFFARRDATLSACEANRRLIVAAVNNYQSNTGSNLTEETDGTKLLAKLVREGYLAPEPKDPFSGSTYTLSFRVRREENGTHSRAVLHVDVNCPNQGEHHHGKSEAPI